MDPLLDEDLEAYFGALTPEQWTSLLRQGLETHAASVARGARTPDYSGFLGARSVLDQKVPVEGLTRLYEALPNGKPQAAFREGIRLAVEEMRPPPAAETQLIAPELLQLAARVRAASVVDVLARRYAAVPAWRESSSTYLGALLFAYKVETHADTARLLRAIVGPPHERSSQFSADQIRPILHAMISSEPSRILEHIRFLSPQLEQAQYQIRDSVASELLALRGRTIDEANWEIAQPHFPNWLSSILEQQGSSDSVRSWAIVQRYVESALEANQDAVTEANVRVAFELATQMGTDAVRELVQLLKQKQGARKIDPIARAAAAFSTQLESVQAACQSAREIDEYIRDLRARSSEEPTRAREIPAPLRLVSGGRNLSEAMPPKPRTAS